VRSLPYIGWGYGTMYPYLRIDLHYFESYGFIKVGEKMEGYLRVKQHGDFWKLYWQQKQDEKKKKRRKLKKKEKEKKISYQE